MSKKQKVLKIVVVVLLCYAAFVAAVISLYRNIRYDPEDGAATDYLHMSEELKEEIGEVRYVAARTFEKEIEDENGLHIVYAVETYDAEYRITVHFQKTEDEWIPYGYTILEQVEVYQNH